MDENRKKQQDTVIGLVNKHFGEQALMRFNSDDIEPIEVISSGSVFLDNAMGVLGYPKGRVIEIYGPESSGKTTLTLHAIAECQKAGGAALFVDAEHALDIQYAQALGVNVDDLIISQPSYGEQALAIVDTVVKSGTVDLVVVDSIAALVPKAELDGEVGDHHIGVQARMMGQALRKLAGAAHESNCTVIFINQLRQKIGVMFGNPETTPGGNALKFYASIRLDIRRLGAIKKGEDAIGNRVKVKVVKNKVAPPFKECEFDILFGQGINSAGEILDLAAEKGLVEKSGAWFKYKGENMGQGRDNTVAYLESKPQLVEELKQQLK